MASSRRRGWFVIGAVASGVGCAGAHPPPPAAQPDPPVHAERPPDAAEIARDLVDGRVGALFYVDRFRYRLGARRITGFGQWGPLVEAVGLDALDDAAIAFATARRFDDQGGVVVVALRHADDVRVARNLAKLAERPRSRWVTAETGMPAVATVISGEPRIVAAPRSGLLVGVPPAAAGELVRFATSGGLPSPRAREAARFFAFEPAESLGDFPPWPRSVYAARADIELNADGAQLSFMGFTSSGDEAERDAAQMTSTVNGLLQVNVLFLKLNLLDPVHFEAAGTTVVMSTHLLPGDVDWILGFGAP